MKTFYQTIEVRDKDHNLIETVIIERKQYTDTPVIFEPSVNIMKDYHEEDMDNWEFYYFEDETEI